MNIKYQVIFYTKNNQSPVQKFIKSLEKQSHAKIIRLLTNTQEFGIIAIKKYVKKLAGTPLWELRILGKQSVRLIYFYQRDNIIFVLHGFIKKSQKTPLKELKIALKRYVELTYKS